MTRASTAARSSASMRSCKACRREIPWELMRDLRCAEHVAIYHAKKDARPWLILAEATERVKAATRAIFNHLKQHSPRCDLSPSPLPSLLSSATMDRDDHALL